MRLLCSSSNVSEHTLVIYRGGIFFSVCFSLVNGFLNYFLAYS